MELIQKCASITNIYIYTLLIQMCVLEKFDFMLIDIFRK
jgi:hypothetical protein